MSHKKKASVAFKSIGAAGLAAATIVSGLSFGSAAMAAPSESPKASVNAYDTEHPFKLVWKKGNEFLTAKANSGQYTSAYVSEALKQAPEVVFDPANGYIKRVDDGRCLGIDTFPDGVADSRPNSSLAWQPCSDFANTSVGPWTFDSNGVPSIRGLKVTGTVTAPSPFNGSFLYAGTGTALAMASTYDPTPTVPSNPAAIVGQTGTSTTLGRGTDTEVEAVFKTSGSVSKPEATVEFTAPAGTTFAAGQSTVNGSYQKPGEGWTNESMTLTNGVRSADGTKYTYDFTPTETGWGLPDASLMKWGIEVTTPAGAAAATGSMSAKLVGTATEGSYNTTATTPTTIEAPAPAPLKEIIATTPSGEAGTTSSKGTAKVQDEQVVGPMTLTAPTGTTFADVAARHVSDDVVQGNYRYTFNADRTTVTIDGPENNSGAYWGTKNQYVDYTLNIPASAAAGTITGGTATVAVDGVNLAVGAFGVTVTANVAAPTGTVTFSDDVTQKATVSGTGVDGATITLYAGDSTTAIGTAVVRNGTWSTTIDPIGAGDQKIRIEQSGIDGIQTADTTAEYGAAVVLDEPASSTVTPGAVTVTGTGQADTTVTITGGDKPVTTTVKADGTFTAEVVLEPSNTAKTLTAQQHSKGNLTTSDTITVTPNGAQTAREVVITEPTSHTYQPNRATTISGTATPYATVELRFQWNDTVYGTATADINGNWSITRGFGPAAKYELTATQTRFDKTTSTSTMFTLDPEGITNKEIVITGPADHAYKPGEPTRVTGTATPFAKIELRFQWNDTVYGTATANADGEWNILRAYGPAATYELTAKQLRADGTTSLSNSFTLAPTGIDRPFTLTTPTMDSTFEAGVPVSFTGTGTRGAKITAIAPAWNNNEIFTTEVDDNGMWQIRRGLATGITYDLTLVQQPVDGEPTSISGVHLKPAS
ncbi:hypothetical protein ABRP24_016805 [Curtobacterium sp. WHRI 8282]|uniref:hypothetical protein n=1 Tax=Curtobacterium sp. WHRI 8282 TaxID=3162559 RepID=UPI0032EE9C50